jgi:hypothetical protein
MDESVPPDSDPLGKTRRVFYLAMLHLACGIITWRATGLLG